MGAFRPLVFRLQIHDSPVRLQRLLAQVVPRVVLHVHRVDRVHHALDGGVVRQDRVHAQHSRGGHGYHGFGRWDVHPRRFVVNRGG